MQKNINKSLIMAPMPVLIIGTYDENNVPNAMNAASIYPTGIPAARLTGITFSCGL